MNVPGVSASEEERFDPNPGFRPATLFFGGWFALLGLVSLAIAVGLAVTYLKRNRSNVNRKNATRTD
jgi:hypothetical protein